MYALPLTGPPCARTCLASSYPSLIGNKTFIRITSNSMFAHAAAAWLAFSAKCVEHPKWSSRRPMDMRESCNASTTITRTPLENVRKPGHACASVIRESSGAKELSWLTNVNAHREARSTAPAWCSVSACVSLCSVRRGNDPTCTPVSVSPPLRGNTPTMPSWPMRATSPPHACTESTALAKTPDRALPNAFAHRCRIFAASAFVFFPRASALICVSASAAARRSSSKKPSNVATTTAETHVCLDASFA
mmetsp:Transcript_9912/g.32774  ORF Transcript_9912/g.32774 Transcript_9912/m.32774 type:complete len:249 (+) Transcript_9912:8515-9261(+)